MNELKEKQLFEDYMKLQREKWKNDVLGYEHFEHGGHDLIIKVNFTWGWLRVYRNKENKIKWY